MEFYESADIPLNEQDLQQIAIPHLPEFCASIDRVLAQQGDEGRIDCLWGEIVVRRETIRHGVRFSLPSCPNNLAWTITSANDYGTDHVVIHVTIRPQHHELEFIDSIHTFVADWKRGLENESRINNIFSESEKAVVSE